MVRYECNAMLITPVTFYMPSNVHVTGVLQALIYSQTSHPSNVIRILLLQAQSRQKTTAQDPTSLAPTTGRRLLVLVPRELPQRPVVELGESGALQILVEAAVLAQQGDSVGELVNGALEGVW